MARRFFRNQNLSFPSLDQIGLSTLIGFSGFTLFNAYQEGIDPLVDQDRSNDCCYKDHTNNNNNNNNNESSSLIRRQQHNTTQFALTPEQCRIMEKEGFLVIDGFLSKNELQNAAKSARYMEHKGLFGASPNEKEENVKTSGTTEEEEMNNINVYKNASEEDKQQIPRQVRTDKVCFIKNQTTDDNDADGGEKQDNMNGIYHVRRLLRGVAHQVVTSDFQGFQDEAFSSTTAVKTKNSNNHHINKNVYLSQNSWIGVPTSMQVSLYNTLQQHPEDEDSSENSSQKQNKYKGAYYHPHRDGCTDSFLELGLLGWLRSHYLRRRYLTCILYLNETEEQGKEQYNGHDDIGKKGAWTKEDGGYLRLFIGADKSDDTGESIISKQAASKETEVRARIVDIEPKGGRIVIFSSEHTLHAVLPSFRRRIACTVWLTLNGD